MKKILMFCLLLVMVSSVTVIAAPRSEAKSDKKFERNAKVEAIAIQADVIQWCTDEQLAVQEKNEGVFFDPGLTNNNCIITKEVTENNAYAAIKIKTPLHDPGLNSANVDTNDKDGQTNTQATDKAKEGNNSNAANDKQHSGVIPLK